MRGEYRRLTTSLVRLITVAALAGLILGVCVAPVALPLVAATGAGNSFVASLPSSLTQPQLAQTSVMLAANGSPIAYFYDENRTELPLDQISPLVQQAVVAIEDARFYQHGGVDPRGILRAIVNDLSGRSLQGGSTLTQQYVKNVLLEQATAHGDAAAAQAAVAPTISRKLREMKLAIALDRRMTKQQILEGYLNIAFFGGHSYGIEAAARRYFGVSAADLTLPQAATLAGMVQEPGTYNPIAHPAAARARRDVVLKAMLDQKMITSQAYTAAVATPMTADGHALPNGCVAAGRAGFFCDYVVRTILTDPAFATLGGTPTERMASLDRGGLVVRTTLDRTAQAAAEDAVQRWVPATDRTGLGAAAVTVEPGTGKVLAMAENRSFSITAGRGLTSVNYSTDTALGGSSGFQTGSSFKPFTLATWLAHGHSLSDVVDATKRSFPFHDFTACGHPLVGSKPYRPGNSEGTETGPMPVMSATTNSVNVAYVDMESQLDLCDIAATAQSLGVHLAAPEQECSATAAPSTDLPTCLPSLTLGVKNIAPLTMAAAYAGFATGGVYCSPLAVTSLTHAGSTPGAAATVDVGSPSCRRALSSRVASGVNDALTRVLTSGTAAATGPLRPWPSAGKTGTTDGPYDSWFVGYTAQRSTAVWVGDPGSSAQASRRRLANLVVGGRYYGTIYGASIAAPIWKAMMSTIQQGLPAQPLP